MALALPTWTSEIFFNRNSDRFLEKIIGLARRVELLMPNLTGQLD